jgi:hypothetical protein
MHTEFEIEEYKRLTKEIETSSNRVYQIITIVISFSTVIVSLSVQNYIGYYLPLTLHTLLIISLFLISSQINATHRIGTYIHLHYENRHTNILWESKLIKQKENKKVRSKYNFSIFSITILFGFISQLIATIKVFFEYDTSGTSFKLKAVETSDLTIYLLVLAFVIIGYIRGFQSIMKSKNIDRHLEFWNNT